MKTIKNQSSLLQEVSFKSLFDISHYDPEQQNESTLTTNTVEPKKGKYIDHTVSDWDEVDCTSLHYDIQFIDTESYNYDAIYPTNKSDLTLLDVYRKLIDDATLELIVRETNWYAQQIKNSKIHRRSSRMHTWKDTDTEEIVKFFGIIFNMGIVKFPKTADYWGGSPL